MPNLFRHPHYTDYRSIYLVYGDAETSLAWRKIIHATKNHPVLVSPRFAIGR